MAAARQTTTRCTTHQTGRVFAGEGWPCLWFAPTMSELIPKMANPKNQHCLRQPPLSPMEGAIAINRYRPCVSRSSCRCSYPSAGTPGRETGVGEHFVPPLRIWRELCQINFPHRSPPWSKDTIVSPGPRSKNHHDNTLTRNQNCSTTIRLSNTSHSMQFTICLEQVNVRKICRPF